MFWSHLKYYHEIFPERLRKITKALNTGGFRVETKTRRLP